MKIDDLIKKYFEGNTSCEEERALKSYFREKNIRPDHEIYRPLFAFFDVETVSHRAVKPRRRFLYSFSGLAAVLLLALCVTGLIKLYSASDYVIIDGQKFADTQMAHEQAKIAFQDVCFSREEIFDTLFNE